MASRTAGRKAGLQDLMDRLKVFSGPGEGYLWHRNVTGVNLNPHQMLYFDFFEKEPRIVLKGSRRIRKSYAAAAWFLKEAVTKPGTEINIFAPAVEQSKRNIQYMTDFILRSELLSNFLEQRQGGVALGRESIRFRNGSKVQAKGQASSVDGLGSTHIWLEEVDDMDWEAIQTRILPTGAMMKDNYDYGQIGGCQVIVTATIKGQGNLYAFEHPNEDTPPHLRYKTAPVFDCWDGIEMGVMNEDYIEAQRGVMTVEQFARTYLCLYTESHNFFPTRFLNRCFALELNGQPLRFIEPDRTGRYRPHGTVVVGIDYAGQGSDPDGYSSNTCVTFLDVVSPDLMAIIYCEEFDSMTPPQEIRARMRTLLRYFWPRRGVADAYDTTLTHLLCKDAWDLGLTKGLNKDGGGGNPERYEHGEGKEGWESWFIMPVRFSGPRKHKMYMRCQRAVYERGLLIPPVIEDTMSVRLEKVRNQMEGMKATPTEGSYDKYEPVNRLLGDDYVDSLVAAMEAGAMQRPKYPAFGGSAGGVGDGGFDDKRFVKTPTFHSTKFKS